MPIRGARYTVLQSTISFTEQTFFEALYNAGKCNRHLETHRLNSPIARSKSLWYKARAEYGETYRNLRDQFRCYHANDRRHPAREHGNTKSVAKQLTAECEDTSASQGIDLDAQSRHRRARTTIGLPVMLTRSELAEYIDPSPVHEPKEIPSSINTPTSIFKHRSFWPSRLKEFIGSLPIRNYANDFVIWDMTPDEVWRRYQLVPQPRCQAISATALRYVLSALSRERPRTRQGMLRYMSIFDEMRSQQPPVVPLVAEWSAAMSFVGRMHKRPRSEDLGKCLDLWEEMEQTFGLKADRVTFNILLDVSIRARKWQTADSIVTEMKNRKIKFDRYTWTSLIYRAGVQGNGPLVRRTARNMIESGEIVDIVVINAIMSALIRAGDGQEADHMFERIKSLALEMHHQQDNREFPHPLTREMQTRLTSQYQQKAWENKYKLKSGELLSDDDIAPRSNKTAYYLSPDEASFNMLLQYHCEVTGDYSRVTLLLEDMERFNIPDSEALYLSLFSGFIAHGSPRSEWTLSRLEYVFQVFLDTPTIRRSQALTLRVIGAYKRVGRPSSIRAVWEKLDKAWQEQGGDTSRRSSNIEREVAAADLLSEEIR